MTPPGAGRGTGWNAERAVEQLETLAHVGVVLRGTPHVEVLARARDLEAVLAPLGREPGDLLEREVDPLAGEQGDGQPPRAGHDASWSRSRNWMERRASGRAARDARARGRRPPRHATRRGARPSTRSRGRPSPTRTRAGRPPRAGGRPTGR